MKKLWPVVLISALVLGGCNKISVINNQTEVTPTLEASGSGSGEWSLKDLLNKGIAQKCTWSMTNDAGSSEGIMYLSGKKFKQEVTTKTAEGAETKTINVSDGENMYLWSDEMGKQGIKMALDSSQNEGYTTENNSVDWDAKNSYNCSPVTVSEADLAPPSDIEYMDVGAQLKELQNKFGTLPTGTEE